MGLMLRAMDTLGKSKSKERQAITLFVLVFSRDLSPTIDLLPAVSFNYSCNILFLSVMFFTI